MATLSIAQANLKASRAHLSVVETRHYEAQTQGSSCREHVRRRRSVDLKEALRHEEEAYLWAGYVDNGTDWLLGQTEAA